MKSALQETTRPKTSPRPGGEPLFREEAPVLLPAVSTAGPPLRLAGDPDDEGEGEAHICRGID